MSSTEETSVKFDNSEPLSVSPASVEVENTSSEKASVPIVSNPFAGLTAATSTTSPAKAEEDAEADDNEVTLSVIMLSVFELIYFLIRTEKSRLPLTFILNPLLSLNRSRLALSKRMKLPFLKCIMLYLNCFY